MELVSNISAQISLSATPDARGVAVTEPDEGQRPVSHSQERQVLRLAEQPICPFLSRRRSTCRQYALSPSVGGRPCRQSKERRYPVLTARPWSSKPARGPHQENERTMDGFRSIR